MAFIIEIDDSLETPLYAQIKLSVISGIKTGKLKPGDVLLSSRELVKSLGINYHTVNKAYDLLVQERFLIRDKKKRTFVNKWASGDDSRFLKRWEDLEKSLIEEAKARGVTSVRILDIVREALGNS